MRQKIWMRIHEWDVEVTIVNGLLDHIALPVPNLNEMTPAQIACAMAIVQAQFDELLRVQRRALCN